MKLSLIFRSDLSIENCIRHPTSILISCFAQKGLFLAQKLFWLLSMGLDFMIDRSETLKIFLGTPNTYIATHSNASTIQVPGCKSDSNHHKDYISSMPGMSTKGNLCRTKETENIDCSKLRILSNRTIFSIVKGFPLYTSCIYASPPSSN